MDKNTVQNTGQHNTTQPSPLPPNKAESETSCEWAHAQLLLDGPLVPVLQRHLESCPNCATTADLLGSMHRVLAPTPTPRDSALEQSLRLAVSRRRTSWWKTHHWSRALDLLPGKLPAFQTLIGTGVACGLLLAAHVFELKSTPSSDALSVLPVVVGVPVDSLASVEPAPSRAWDPSGDSLLIHHTVVGEAGKNDSI
jgi:hypothetical protein